MHQQALIGTHLRSALDARLFARVQLNRDSIGCLTLLTAFENRESAAERFSCPFFFLTGVNTSRSCSVARRSFIEESQ